MTETVIAAEGLAKEFKTRGGKEQAVADLTLAVAGGETFGLIGPDGAGKTTATRVMLGLLTRSGGRSSILGYDSMRDTYAIRERVGYIAQQFALPSDLSVIENMRFFAHVQGVSRFEQKKRIPALLEFAGLSEFTGRLAGRLSGGMKKKLALACSLVHEPQVLMLDEPTLGVDPVSRRQFWNLLADLRVEKGLTIFVCTPYMDEAERCNRIGLMYKGRLVAYDTPSAVKKQVSGRLLEFAPSRPGPAIEILSRLDGILEVQSYGLMLHVLVDEPDKCIPEIETALTAAGVGCDGMREIEVRMEEAFVSLIRRLESAQQGSKPSARYN